MLTVAELRKHIETPLGDDALRRLLDAAAEDIAHYTGETEYISPSGIFVPLSYPADTIVSVSEDGTTLAADDYELSGSGLMLRRLNDGTNPRRGWHPRPITVTYTRQMNEATKELVQIALVQHDLREPGVRQQQIGGWGTTYAGTYGADRIEILSRLSGPTAVVWPA